MSSTVIPSQARARMISIDFRTDQLSCGRARAFIVILQDVYLSVPPPEGATMDDIEAGGLPEFYRQWMVIRPMLRNPKRGPDIIRRLKAKGCSVWTYQCNYYLQRQDILSYCRLYPMEAYLMERSDQSAVDAWRLAAGRAIDRLSRSGK